MAGHRTVVCLGVLCAFLTAALLALIGVLIWREVFTRKPPVDDPTMIPINASNIEEVLLKFPGYFRTPEEQKQLEAANMGILTPQFVRNISQVHRRCFYDQPCHNLSTPHFTSTISWVYGNTKTYAQQRKKRVVDSSDFCSLDVLNLQDLTFHGCCISHSSLMNVTTLPTAEPGKSGNVEVAQFPQLKQYFEIQQCCQAQECTGCNCAQTYYVVSAVVVKKIGSQTYYKTEFVRVPGCCKCLNTDK